MNIIKIIIASHILILSQLISPNEDLNIIDLYKELHSNPELSFKEIETSQKLSSILKELGYEVTENFGGYGIVAFLKNGDGKTVLIRADMDALPVKEETNVSYASSKESTDQLGNKVFTMHACGHDIHMATLIGVAKNFAENKENWNGKLIFVLQPAEEVSGGARAMISAGLFKKFPQPDYNLALHVSADIPAGKVGVIEEWAMANVDSVDIIIKGQGGHGAYPHKTLDPIVLASQIISSLQTIVSREIAPIDPAVLTVGSIHGGTKHNIIPNEVTLQLTIRSYKDEVRRKIISSIRRISKGHAISAGIPEKFHPEVILKDEYTPAVYNDPKLTKLLKNSFISSLGLENVLNTPPVMAGEDFGMYGRTEPKIPTSLFWLGAVNIDDYQKAVRDNIPLPSLHSSLFLPDYEPTLTTGITAMTSAVEDLLKIN